jgi:SAM-dependent methyltransferase
MVGFAGMKDDTLFQCPVCDTRVSAFEPLHEHYRRAFADHGTPFQLEDFETLNVEGYSCPRCGAADRDRLYALFVRKAFPRRAKTMERRPFRILDFAPAKPLADFLKQWFGDREQSYEYRSADLFMDGVDDKVDLMDLGRYPDGSWDLVVCSHVLEHVPDDRKALRELFRVLRPGGRAILMAPICLKATAIDEDPSVTDEAERWRRFGQEDHVRLYTRDGFLDRLRDAGFEIAEWRSSSFKTGAFERAGITGGSVLYVGTKRRNMLARLAHSIRKRASRILGG